MNKLTIIGDLTADPEVRYIDTAGGQQLVCNFSVAVNRTAGGKKITDFFRVTCWNRQADNASKYLYKGSKVAVVGAVTAQGYISRDGAPKASMDIAAETIEYLNSRQDAQAQGQQQAPPAQGYGSIDGFTQVPEGPDEQLPFN